MNFVVEGENIQTIKVYDVNQNEWVEDLALRPIFFENGVYQFIVASKQHSNGFDGAMTDRIGGSFPQYARQHVWKNITIIPIEKLERNPTAWIKLIFLSKTNS